MRAINEDDMHAVWGLEADTERLKVVAHVIPRTGRVGKAFGESIDELIEAGENAEACKAIREYALYILTRDTAERVEGFGPAVEELVAEAVALARAGMTQVHPNAMGMLVGGKSDET